MIRANGARQIGPFEPSFSGRGPVDRHDTTQCHARSGALLHAPRAFPVRDHPDSRRTGWTWPQGFLDLNRAENYWIYRFSSTPLSMFRS